MEKNFEYIIRNQTNEIKILKENVFNLTQISEQLLLMQKISDSVNKNQSLEIEILNEKFSNLSKRYEDESYPRHKGRKRIVSL